MDTKSLSNLSDKKKDIGSKINLFKQTFFSKIRKKKKAIEQTLIKKELQKEQIDISLQLVRKINLILKFINNSYNQRDCFYIRQYGPKLSRRTRYRK